MGRKAENNLNPQLADLLKFLLQRAQEHGYDEKTFWLACALGELLDASSGSAKKRTTESFLHKLEETDADAYAVLGRALTENMLNTIRRIARAKRRVELGRAIELVLGEVSLLGIGEVACELGAETDSALRYRVACRYLQELENANSHAAEDLAHAALVWYRELAKKRGDHGIVAAVEEIVRVSEGIYGNYHRLASTREQ